MRADPTGVHSCPLLSTPVHSDLDRVVGLTHAVRELWAFLHSDLKSSVLTDIRVQVPEGPPSDIIDENGDGQPPKQEVIPTLMPNGCPIEGERAAVARTLVCSVVAALDAGDLAGAAAAEVADGLSVGLHRPCRPRTQCVRFEPLPHDLPDGVAVGV